MELSEIKLATDGELEPSANPDTPDEESKEKRVEFNSPPITLWARPFPDQAGYEKVELYVDPDLTNTWGYVVLCIWYERSSSSGTTTHTRRLYGSGYSDKDMAVQEGIQAYKEQVHKVVEQSNTPKVFNYKDWAIMSCFMSALFSALFAAAWFLWLKPTWPDTPNSTGILAEIVLLALGLLFSWIVESSTPDYR